VFCDSPLLSNSKHVTLRAAMNFAVVEEQAVQNVVTRKGQSNSIYSKQNMTENNYFCYRTSPLISSIDPEATRICH
jgi:hypothetical protein